MNQDEIDGLNARTQALSMTVSALIQGLPAEVTAAAAQQLATTMQVEQSLDAEEGNSPAFVANRDALAEVYLRLLIAASRR